LARRRSLARLGYGDSSDIDYYLSIIGRERVERFKGVRGDIYNAVRGKISEARKERLEAQVKEKTE
jgi:hypothetical protein